MRRGAVARLAGGILLLATLGSCAYYNTFFLARRYYERATGGAPYVTENTDAGAVGHFNKSIEYSKKLLANYPKSKWVDDAYLLWARALLGKDDPLEAMTMLRDFPTRYPESSLKDPALFYLGVAGRKARKYTEALAAIDEFLQKSKDKELVPLAHLERTRILMSLERPADAAQAATVAIQKISRKRPDQRDLAVRLRAEALLTAKQYEGARADYRYLGKRAKTDEERFGFLLKEADTYEVAREYDAEMALLRDALTHETEPGRPGVADPAAFQGGQPVDRYGRLLVRIGTVHALAGRKEEALQALRRVIERYPRSALAGEAQFRIAYVVEMLGDDFDAARTEYAKVQQQAPTSPFVAQAVQRLANLERLSQFRQSAGADSVGKKAESEFMLAELYLFQLEKPERALEEYRKIAAEHPGTPYAAKALNAQAWVLRRKMNQAAEADSLLWAVVRNYPATEAQLDARDYLERAGHTVPSALIKMPERPRPAAADSAKLTMPPAVDSLGVRRVVTPATMDSLLRRNLIRATPELLSQPRAGRDSSGAARPDTARTARSSTSGSPAPADSAARKPEP